MPSEFEGCPVCGNVVCACARGMKPKRVIRIHLDALGDVELEGYELWALAPGSALYWYCEMEKFAVTPCESDTSTEYPGHDDCHWAVKP